MKLQGAFLRSKVARRIFLLFVLSAALPMAITSVLSIFEVNKMLINQSRAELSRLSESYGQAMYERLLMVEDRLSHIPLQQNLEATQEIAMPAALRERVKALAIVLANAPEAPAPLSYANTLLSHLSPEQRSHISSGKSLVITGKTDNDVTHVLLVRAARDEGRNGQLLIAEIEPRYLWGDNDDLPSMIDLCVLNEIRVVLHCSNPSNTIAVSALNYASVRTSSGQLDWRIGEDAQVGGYQDVFMNPQYLAQSWTVIANTPEHNVLARIATFRQIYLPIIGASMLLIGILSVSQIRRTLVPLERLIDATRSVTHRRFDTRVEVSRHDEFGELALSFNSMTAQLGRQFSALTTLSEIDRAILSTTDIDQVLQLILARLHDIVPADYACLTVVDNDNSETARNYVRDYSTDSATVITRTPFAPQDQQSLLRVGDAAWIEPKTSHAYLQPLAGFGITAYFVLPIVWKDQVTGAVVLGYLSRPDAIGEHETHAREFRDRLGVALSSAAREEQLYFQARYDALTKCHFAA